MTNSRKRVRDDSELVSNTPESKRVNSSTESDPNQLCVTKDPEPDRVDSDPELIESSEMEHIPEDILDILGDSETVDEREQASQDLDSVMKSFEKEMHHQPSFSSSPVVLDLTSDSGESQPELGYLLEASDDELGLPPTERTATNELPNDLTVENSSDNLEMGSMIEFENEFPSFDLFEYGLSESTAPEYDISNNNNSNGDFVTVDGLFDYSELSDFSGLSWQPESLPAL